MILNNLIPKTGELIDILPTLISTVLCITALLVVSGSRLSKSKTLLVIIPYTLLIMALNGSFFKDRGNKSFENWFIISVFFPEAIITSVIGKRRGISLITGILNAYLAFYLIFIVESISFALFKESLLNTLIVYSISFPLVIIYLWYFYNKLHHTMETVLKNNMWILLLYGALLIIEIRMYQYILEITDRMHFRVEIFGFAILSTYIISITGFNVLLNNYNRKVKEITDSAILKRQIDIISDEAKHREEKENHLKILRHDMKHLLIVVSQLIQNNENEKAITMLQEFEKDITDTKLTIFCNEPIINSVLEYYNHQCIQKNIKFYVQVDDFESLIKVPINDFAIVISNCLDNAIKATEKLKDNAFISFKLRNNKDRLVLQIKNKYANKIDLDENNLPTNREEEHGFGTKSIDQFVKANNLTLDYTITKNYFTISILF